MALKTLPAPASRPIPNFTSHLAKVKVICNLFLYCQVLEDVGIWDKIKRLAGCGVGALVAALLAVGYNSYHIERFLKHDIRKLVFGTKVG